MKYNINKQLITSLSSLLTTLIAIPKAKKTT